MILPSVESADAGDAETPDLVVVDNWFSELERLVPVN